MDMRWAQAPAGIARVERPELPYAAPYIPPPSLPPPEYPDLPAEPGWQPVRKRALLVGVSYARCGDARWGLRGCVNDVHCLKHLLMTRYGCGRQSYGFKTLNPNILKYIGFEGVCPVPSVVHHACPCRAGLAGVGGCAPACAGELKSFDRGLCGARAGSSRMALSCCTTSSRTRTTGQHRCRGSLQGFGTRMHPHTQEDPRLVCVVGSPVDAPMLVEYEEKAALGSVNCFIPHLINH